MTRLKVELEGPVGTQIGREPSMRVYPPRLGEREHDELDMAHGWQRVRFQYSDDEAAEEQRATSEAA